VRNIVLISYTPLDASGGVPRWNRDFVAGFPGTKHYSWWDVLPSVGGKDANIPEWDKARILNQWLIWSKRVTKDDVIIVDGFWGLGLEEYDVISVAHGIWSHLTQKDVEAGKQPEFPVHNKVQSEYRKKHLERGGKIVAVSDFIANQMKLQWGFESEVINNAIDLEKFRPVQKMSNWTDSRLVIHGVTTHNKGFDHIEAVKNALPNDDVMLLDEAAAFLELPKYEALANADLVVQPSAYEGNSYFVLETLACDVPIVAYDVGLLYSISTIAKNNGIIPCIGSIINRDFRSPEETAKVAKFILDSVSRERSLYNPRKVAELFSIQNFHEQWKGYLTRHENDRN
jgi:glycosyltransferase involved in cell wall biosynthesis